VKLGADGFAVLEESIAIFHRIAVMSPACTLHAERKNKIDF